MPALKRDSLRRLQRGESLGLPNSRPMASVGAGCHELRIVDGRVNWRIMYYLAADTVVILDVFQKKTEATPKVVIANCQHRLADFLKLSQTKKGVGHARR